MKQNQKNKIIEQLKRLPIVETACRQTNVSRASFYRWKNEDEEFKKAIEEAMTEGQNMINDMSESQLLTAIKNGNLTAIIFWLKNKHPDFKEKRFQSALTIAQDENNNVYFELFGKLKPETEKLLESHLKKDDDES